MFLILYAKVHKNTRTSKFTNLLTFVFALYFSFFNYMNQFVTPL